MINNVHVVNFSRVKDEDNNSHIHSLSATLYVAGGDQIQFVSKHPFQLDFTGGYPFTTGATPILGVKTGGNYQSDTLTVASLSVFDSTSAFSYTVTLDVGGHNQVSEDPQVIVDPDQSGKFSLMIGLAAGAVAGAVTALMLAKSKS